MQKGVEKIRKEVRCGLCSSIYEEVAFLCLLFVYDVQEKGQFLEKAEIQAALAAIRGSAFVLLEAAQIEKREDMKQAIGRLATFGIMQAITHLVQATELLLKTFGTPSEKLKKSYYWNFRNIHSHVERYANTNKYGLNIHEMPPENTSFGVVRYASYGKRGFSIQSFSIERGLRELSFDLRDVFRDCLMSFSKN